MFGNEPYYAKPSVASEIRMQEALIKQQKQKELREALDKQILEMAERKKGYTGGRRSSKIGALPVSPKAMSPKAPTAPSPTAPSPRAAAPSSPSARRASTPKGAPSAVGNQSYEIEPQRYTLNFEDGQANFTPEPVVSPPAPKTKATAPKGKTSKTKMPAVKPGRAPTTRKAVPTKAGRGTGSSARSDGYQTNSLPADFQLPKAGPKEETYDTSSLPVDAIYQLSQSPNALHHAPEEEYNTNSLPVNSNLMEDVKSRLNKVTKGKKAPQAAGKKSKTPANGRRTPQTTPSYLPPSFEMKNENGLPSPNSRGVPESPLQNRVSNSRERGPRSSNMSPDNAGRPASNSLVNELNRKLETNEEQLRRMREKEKSWEDQVKQLRAELKSARDKEKELVKAVDRLPRRAETAPEGSPKSNQRGMIPAQPTSAIPQSRNQKNNFLKTRRFSRENFRPVTVPDIPTEFLDDDPRGAAFDEPDEVIVMEESMQEVDLPSGTIALSVPIGAEHLLQFAKAQIITKAQADKLWEFFCRTHLAPDEDEPRIEESILVEEVAQSPSNRVSRPDYGSPVVEVVMEESFAHPTLSPLDVATEAVHEVVLSPEVKRASVPNKAAVESSEEDDDEEEESDEEETDDDEDDDDEEETDSSEEEDEEEDDEEESEDTEDEEEEESGEVKASGKVVLAPGLRSKISRRFTEENEG